MSNMSNLKIETGSSPAEERFSITVTETGPYLVYGRPPLAEQFIMPDESNDSWYFQEGRHFSTESEPTALCRCGASRRKPYCDGSHEKASWDPRLTAQRDALLDNAEVIDGGTLLPPARRRMVTHRAVRRSRSAQAGRPRSFDVSQRPSHGMGQRDDETL